MITKERWVKLLWRVPLVAAILFAINRIRKNKDLAVSLVFTLSVGLGAGLVAGLLFGLRDGLIAGPLFGISAGLISGLNFVPWLVVYALALVLILELIRVWIK